MRDDMFPTAHRGGTGEAGLRQGAAATGERFLILAREAGGQTESLRKVLERLGTVEVVVDRLSLESGGGDHVYLSDDIAGSFGGMMSNSSPFPWVTAWSRALCHLSRTLRDDEAVWFVEDDVAGDAASFCALVRETVALDADLVSVDVRVREEDAHWPFWRYAEGLFSSPARSFQPLCRLSGRLLRAVLAFREKHGRCTFHEVMFPSVARESGMSWKSWCREAAFKNLLGDFRFRPSVAGVFHGVSHPVKDAAVHQAICSLPPAEFPRIRRAALQGWSLLREDYVFLARYCRRMGIRQVVEFGPGDSTLALLDAGCEVLSFEHDAGWLQTAVERFDGESRVNLRLCPEGTVPEAGGLAFEPELVFVDGPPFREGQEMSRLQPCEWALERCGAFILHDAKREGEMATLAEMERRGMRVTRIPTRKGLAVVVDPARRPEVVAEMSVGAVDSDAGNGWWESELEAWRVFFSHREGAVRILEIGSGNGASASRLLDLIFTHHKSQVHCIDLHEGTAGEKAHSAFLSCAAQAGKAEQLHLYEGLSREVLAWMIAGDGYWQGFDFVHLAAPTKGSELLGDACQAWEMLKPGGVMVFGPGAVRARDAFLEVFGDRLEVILQGDRVAVSKRR